MDISLKAAKKNQQQEQKEPCETASPSPVKGINKNRFGNSKELRIETIDFSEHDPSQWGPMTDPGNRSKGRNPELNLPQRTPGTTDSTTGKKRRRRKADQIYRSYFCSYPGCNRGYGSESSLNQHTRIKHRDTTVKNDNNRRKISVSRQMTSLLPDYYSTLGLTSSSLPFLPGLPFYSGSYPELQKRKPVAKNENTTKCRSWSCSAVEQPPVLSISPANMAMSAMTINESPKASIFDFSFMDNNNVLAEPDWDENLCEYSSNPTVEELMDNLAYSDVGAFRNQKDNQLEHEQSLLDSMLSNDNVRYQPLAVEELPPMESKIQQLCNQ